MAKKEYIVTEENTAGFGVGKPCLKVGSVVELTDEQALMRAGKVVLKSSVVNERSTSKKADTSKLASRIDELEKELTQSKATNVAFKAEIERLRALVK